MSFRTLAIITAVISLVLGLGYIFFGAVVVGRWQVMPTEGVLLVGRRIGSLYLGLSVMYFLSRTAPVSTARTAITTGTAASLLLLVVTGIYELVTGHAGSGILVSIIIEFLLAMGYIRILLTERKASVSELSVQ